MVLAMPHDTKLHFSQVQRQCLLTVFVAFPVDVAN